MLLEGAQATFLDLDLMSALAEYDAGMHITARKYVAPSFREVRHVLNLAVVRAAAPALALVTFDADETLYTDGEGRAGRGRTG